MNDQGISIPYQALYGLKSLIVFYQPFFPSTNQNAQTTAYLITDQCYHGISLNLARFGQIGTVGETVLATDRLVGNAAVGFNVSSGGTSYEYPYGRPATGYLMQTALTNYFNCTAGAGQIGMSANGQARTGFPGLFYGAVGFSVNLTAAQMQQAVQYGEVFFCKGTELARSSIGPLQRCSSTAAIQKCRFTRTEPSSALPLGTCPTLNRIENSITNLE